MLAALATCGFDSLDIEISVLTNPDAVMQLGYPPKRIDLLTVIDGVTFDDAWERRFEVELAGRRAPFISRDDLVDNKRAAGRPQDLADVARLEGETSNDG